MFSFLTPFKMYIYIAIAVFVITLMVYCKMLKSENKQLITDKATAVALNQTQATAITACTKNTQELKDREAELDKNAKAAVEEAKKEALVEFKRSNEILFRKPKAPVITADNAANFGGTDKEEQLKDYLSAQDLANEEIDRRQAARK